MHTLTEGALQVYTFRKCVLAGITHYKFSSPAKRAVPDLILIYKGRVVFVELKSPAKTGKLSKLQLHELKILAKQGAECYVIDEYEHIDELIKCLKFNYRPANYDKTAIRIRPYTSYS